MIGVLSGFEQQIAIPNIFGTRREALTAPCPGRGGSLSGTQNCENNPMQSRNGPHTIRKRKISSAPRRWAERVLAALDASAAGGADRWSHAGCAAPCAGAPHHDVIRSRLISDCIAGPAPALDVTGKPHMAKIAQLFSICSEELMMGHPSWAVSWLWAEITALRGVGEPTCQLTSSTTQLRTLRFSAPVAWDFCQCSSETSSPIGAWPRSTSSMSAPTAAAKSGRL